MPVHVGTSGWQYDDWVAAFYPPGLRKADWLAHYAQRFATVEVNNTFYRLPTRDTFARWAAVTPDDFVVVVKFSRYLTHIKRLREPEEPIARFFGRAEPLGAKLGGILLQLPPTLAADTDLLDGALAAFPDGLRVTVEFRHPSWFVDDVRGVLDRHGAATCLADRDSRLITPVWRTSPWGFVRFHTGRGRPHPCYGRTALDARARLLAETFGPDADVFAFFNNDPHGCAVRDARRFAAACRRHGLEPTRVPSHTRVRIREEAG